MSTTTTTTTATPKAAVLLVHAGFHLPETYAPFLTELSAAGFVVRCPRLPTNGDVKPPKATLHDDVAAVRAEILNLIGAGHRIIVISHSYGGLVASEAITEDLYAKKKTKKNPDDDANNGREEEEEKQVGGGVIQLVYLSAWLLQPGTSLPQLFQKHGFQCALELDVDPTTRMALPKNAPEAFYNDLPAADAQALTDKLVTLNFAQTGTVITGAPWRDVPTTFVHCTRDRGMFLDLQEKMVMDAVEGGGGGGMVMQVKRLEAGHGPFWSMPGAVVRVLEEVWEGYVVEMKLLPFFR